MQHKGVRNVGNTRSRSDVSRRKEGSNRRDSSHNRDPRAKTTAVRITTTERPTAAIGAI